eukprot:g6935.t1
MSRMMGATQSRRRTRQGAAEGGRSRVRSIAPVVLLGTCMIAVLYGNATYYSDTFRQSHHRAKTSAGHSTSALEDLQRGNSKESQPAEERDTRDSSAAAAAAGDNPASSASSKKPLAEEAQLPEAPAAATTEGGWKVDGIVEVEGEGGVQDGWDDDGGSDKGEENKDGNGVQSLTVGGATVQVLDKGAESQGEGGGQGGAKYSGSTQEQEPAEAPEVHESSQEGPPGTEEEEDVSEEGGSVREGQEGVTPPGREEVAPGLMVGDTGAGGDQDLGDVGVDASEGEEEGESGYGLPGVAASRSSGSGVEPASAAEGGAGSAVVVAGGGAGAAANVEAEVLMSVNQKEELEGSDLSLASTAEPPGGAQGELPPQQQEQQQTPQGYVPEGLLQPGDERQQREQEEGQDQQASTPAGLLESGQEETAKRQEEEQPRDGASASHALLQPSAGAEDVEQEEQSQDEAAEITAPAVMLQPGEWGDGQQQEEEEEREEQQQQDQALEYPAPEVLLQPGEEGGAQQEEEEEEEQQEQQEQGGSGAVQGSMQCATTRLGEGVDNIVNIATWKDAPGDADYRHPLAAGNADKYVTLQKDLGGFNNIRLSLESAVAFAAATGRTFVIPPPFTIWNMNAMVPKKEVDLRELFSFDKLRQSGRVNIITTEEFLEKEAYTGQLGIEPNEAVKALGVEAVSSYLVEVAGQYEAGLPDLRVEQSAFVLPRRLGGRVDLEDENYAFAKKWLYGRNLLEYREAWEQAKVIHWRAHEARLLAPFYAVFLHADEVADRYHKRLMRDLMHYPEEVYCKASQIISLLRQEDPSGEFSTFHVRRNDFGTSYKHLSIDPAVVIANSVGHLKDNEVVYVATDEKDLSLFEPFHKHVRVKFLADYYERAGVSELNPNLLGMLDQIIASHGRTFTGCWLSTFTAYILRLRGHLQKPRTSNWSYYNPRATYHHQYRLPENPLWMTEWPLGWEGIDETGVPDPLAARQLGVENADLIFVFGAIALADTGEESLPLDMVNVTAKTFARRDVVAGLSRQSRRLVGRVNNSGVSAAASGAVTRPDGSCYNSNRTHFEKTPPPQVLLLSQSLHVPAVLQRSRSIVGSGCSSRGSSSSGFGGKCGTAVGPGQNPAAAWWGVARGTAAGSVGARRSLSGRSGGEGAGAGSKIGGPNGGSGGAIDGDSGFSETGGADGDGWTPPPDAWQPDEAPAAIPHDAPAASSFEIPGGFSDSPTAVFDAAAAAPEVVTAVTATGLSAADLGMYPHHICMNMIEYVQVNAGVPYWEAIILVSIAARIAVLPAVTTFLGMTKRLNMVKPQMAVHQEKMQDIKNRMEANPEVKEAAMREMMLVSEEMGALLKQHRINFPKMILSMFAQFPVFISLFLATRDMGTYFPGYMTGGMEWMSNLNVPDPTWTLPILTSASMILLMELGSDMPAPQGAGKPKVNPKHMFRVMSVVFVPVTFTMPAGVLIYWTTTNIFGMLQRGLFELRPVQQALGWPMPEDMPQPPEEPAEADFASKEDLERWGGGGKGATGEASRGATEAAERAREAVAKASKPRSCRSIELISNNTPGGSTASSMSPAWWTSAALSVAGLLAHLPAADAHLYMMTPVSRNLWGTTAFQEQGSPNVNYCPHCFQSRGPAAVRERGGGAPWPHFNGERAANGNYIESDEVAKRHGLCGDPEQTAAEGSNLYGLENSNYPVLETYAEGGILEVRIVVSTYHWGHIEMFLCNTADLPDGPDSPVTQSCFNKYPLDRAKDDEINQPIDPLNKGRFFLDPPCRASETDQDLLPGAFPGDVATARFKLPDGVTCERCVVQMAYYTGNSCKHQGYAEFNPESWPGSCASSKADWINEEVGFCGEGDAYPEEFWNCADISIPSGGAPPPGAPPPDDDDEAMPSPAPTEGESEDEDDDDYDEPTPSPVDERYTPSPVSPPTEDCQDPVEAYGQCGGLEYEGSTCCTPGYDCREMADCYSECRPSSRTEDGEDEDDDDDDDSVDDSDGDDDGECAEEWGQCRIMVKVRITLVSVAIPAGNTHERITTSSAINTMTSMATHGLFSSATSSSITSGRSIRTPSRRTTRKIGITSGTNKMSGTGNGTSTGISSLVSFDYIPYCKTWNEAAWKARPGRVLQKVLEFRPTVVCLQEVDENQYHSLFKTNLGSLGYVGAYCKRSGGKSDGCATFVLGNQVRLVEQDDVTYKVQGHPALDRDNVALLVVVDVLSRSQSPPGEESVGEGARVEPSAAGGRGAAARLVIANTHLVFNPKRGDVKTAQLMMLTDRVERLSNSSRADGVMICGDFNMTPDSALYHYMVRGSLAVDGLNRFTVSGQCGPNHSQRQETDNIGTLSARGPGLKHQGSGCSLGSFLRPPNQARMSGGGRKGGSRGGGVRGRGGRGRAPGGSSCQACSNRLPHEASSTYVIADDAASSTATDYRCPPGAAPGTIFAVMDPVPCRCVTADGSCPEESVAGKRKGGSAAGGGGGEAPQRTREPYNPPVLWSVNGDKLAFRRDRGPVSHGLRLESAYAQQADAWGTGEPAFSSYHHMFKGTVDYIFYGSRASSEGEACAGSGQGRGGSSAGATSPSMGEVSHRTEGGGRNGCLRCVGVAEPPLRRDLDRFGGLPSPEEPSDHILLAARFQVMLRC